MAANARSSSVMARSTPPVRRPLAALISSRATLTASAGSASLQTRWPFSSQQKSFLLTAGLAAPLLPWANASGVARSAAASR